MLKTILLAFSFVFCALTSAQTVPFVLGESLPEGFYMVDRVKDGDTFVVTYEGVQRSVRPIGVNTPELHPPQPYAAEATLLTRGLLTGELVLLTPGEQLIDRYGRALAYVVMSDGRDLSLVLAQVGMANLDTKPPNVRFAELYAAAVEGAASVRKGIWAGATGAFVDRNCNAFQTQTEAQAFFEGALTPNRRDAHRLDPDRNARACQALKE